MNTAFLCVVAACMGYTAQRLSLPLVWFDQFDDAYYNGENEYNRPQFLIIPQTDLGWGDAVAAALRG